MWGEGRCVEVGGVGLVVVVLEVMGPKVEKGPFQRILCPLGRKKLIVPASGHHGQHARPLELTSTGAANGATSCARRPAAGVALRGVLRDGAPAVGQPTEVATRARPRDVRLAGPGLRGPRGAGTPGPKRPPAAGGHIATTHHRPSPENGPRCVAAASAGKGTFCRARRCGGPNPSCR